MILPLGDIDGNGKGEFLVGIPEHDGTGVNNGAVTFTSGANISLSASTPYSFSAISSWLVSTYEEQFGYTATNIGDFDNDGIINYLISAPDHTESTGVYLFSGNPSSADVFNEYNNFFFGENPSDGAGYSLGSAGDFDGDSVGDILISAPNHNSDTGKIYLFRGIDINPGELSVPLANSFHTFVGENAGDLAGSSVDFVDDINGDGKSEIVIGAPYYDGNGADNGRVYLVLSTDVDPQVQEMNLSNASYTFTGKAAGDFHGNSVVSRDFNNDGQGDLFFGAHGNDDAGDNKGIVYFSSGSSINNAPVGDISVNDVDHVFRGETPQDGAGKQVASAGDFDGDGMEDMLVFAPDATIFSDTGAGKAYVIKSSILSQIGYLYSLDDVGPTFGGMSTGDFVGGSISGGGDFDGDGENEILIGSPATDSIYIFGPCPEQ